MATLFMAVNTSLYKRMPFDHMKDFTPISQVADVPNTPVTNPKSMQIRILTEFIALLKANPGECFYAFNGAGTASHLATELLKSQAGAEATHVPYKGAAALNELLAGDSVHFMFATIVSAVQHVRNRKLKALGAGRFNTGAVWRLHADRDREVGRGRSNFRRQRRVTRVFHVYR
jgi:tripartite-type tricarboxylate transporter receptor subunit TctC